MATAPRTHPPTPLLNTEQVLAWFGITRATLERWIRSDSTFPVEYIGAPGQRKTRRYDPDKLRTWMSGNTKTPAA